MSSIQILMKEKPWLRRLIVSLVGESGADDLIQETFISAWKSPPKTDRSARPYLAQIAKNKIRMHRRSKSRRLKREDEYSQLVEKETAGNNSSFSETIKTISHCIDRLKEPYKATLRARFLEEMSSTDISKCHGIPASTVRFRIKKGLELIRAELDKEHNGRDNWLFAVSPLTKINGTQSIALGKATVIGKAMFIMKKVLIVIAALSAIGFVSKRLVSENTTTKAKKPHRPQSNTVASRNEKQKETTPIAEQKATMFKRKMLLSEIAKARQDRSETSKHNKQQDKTNFVHAQRPLGEMLSKEYIRDQVREILPLVKECYEHRAAVLENFEGTAVIKFSIIADQDVGGLVETSEYDKEASTLVDDEFEECVQETMYAAEFEAPQEGSGRLDVTFPFTFKMMDEE